MIYRPTTLIGEGVVESDAMANLLHYSKDIRAVSDLRSIKDSFDLIPCDIAARTIVREVLRPLQGINFSNIGGLKRIPVRDLDVSLAMDLGFGVR